MVSCNTCLKKKTFFTMRSATRLKFLTGVWQTAPKIQAVSIFKVCVKNVSLQSREHETLQNASTNAKSHIFVRRRKVTTTQYLLSLREDYKYVARKCASQCRVQYNISFFLNFKVTYWLRHLVFYLRSLFVHCDTPPSSFNLKATR